MKPTPPVRDLNSLPVILKLPEMSAVYRISVPTIRRGLKDNTFRPRPFALFPYRWRRADVIQDLQDRRPMKGQASKAAAR